MTNLATPDRARSILAMPGVVGVDFETNVVKQAHQRIPYVLSLAHEAGPSAVVRLEDPKHQLPWIFEPVITQPLDFMSLVAHNAQFETEVLAKYGVHLDVECTMIAAQCLERVAMPKGEPQPRSYSLAALVLDELGRSRDKSVRDRDWSKPEALDETGIRYALEDAQDTLELWGLLRSRLERDGLLRGYRLLQEAILPTADMNLIGMELDGEAHEKLCKSQDAKLEELKNELDLGCLAEIANHASTMQVGNWIIRQVTGAAEVDDEAMSTFGMRLRARTGYGWRRTATGRLKVDKSTMARKPLLLDDHWPEVADYLRIRSEWTKAKKLQDAFGTKLREFQSEDLRVRGQLAVNGTITGRHSCTNPNMQQQPREDEYRALWQAQKGYKFVICDYGQIELRVMAIESGDENLLEVYRQGEDVHDSTQTVTKVEHRHMAKGVNFLAIYGGGPAALAELLGIQKDKAHVFLERFFNAYTGVKEYRDIAMEFMNGEGTMEQIDIRPNRRIRVDPTLNASATVAVNYPIQGGAASVQMRALRRVWDALRGMDTRLVASIHDEIILEAPEMVAPMVKSLLQHEMREALLEIYPEAVEMRAADLAEAVVVDNWSQKG